MKIKDLPYEGGDRVYIEQPWGERDYGTVSDIYSNDGINVVEVTVDFDTGDYGVYRPEDVLRTPVEKEGGPQ